MTLLTCNAALSLRVLVAQVILNVRQGGKLLLKRSGGAGSRQGNQDNLNTKCCKLQVLLNCLNQRLLKMQKVNLGKGFAKKKIVCPCHAGSPQRPTQHAVPKKKQRCCESADMQCGTVSATPCRTGHSQRQAGGQVAPKTLEQQKKMYLHLGGCQQRLAENVSPNTRRTCNFIMQHVLLAACAPG